MARRGLGGGAMFAGVMAAALLAVPRPAAAHVACPETWNPALFNGGPEGQPNHWTAVPGGWTTFPGTNQNSPQNSDGFFVLADDNPSGTALFRLRDGCGGFGGPDGGTGLFYDSNPGTPCIQATGVGCDPFPEGTTIKYTEANGKTPGVEPMAANNGQGQGNALYIDWHFWGQGDLEICDIGDLVNACICCLVPPPPF